MLIIGAREITFLGGMEGAEQKYVHDSVNDFAICFYLLHNMLR